MTDVISRLEYLRNTLANEHEEAVADAQNEIERLRAELANAEASYLKRMAEAGWKMVPVEPTEDIIDALHQDYHGAYLWSFALAASPEPPK